MKAIKGFDIQFDFSTFQKISDLIYFDGPLLSHYVSGKGDDYLFYWVDNDVQNNRWLALRVNMTNLQKYTSKLLTLRELIENPNDGYVYCFDIDNDLHYHNIHLVQPSDLPEDYLPEEDSYYEFEPIPSMNAEEMMTYELTIPYKQQRRFEEILTKIGFPVSALKKIANRASVL